MASTDIADRVAEEIVAWLDTRSEQVAAAVLESVYRPRVVEPPTSERLALWRAMLILPDGTRNEDGIAQVQQQYGAQGYRDICLALARAARREAKEAD